MVCWDQRHLLSYALFKKDAPFLIILNNKEEAAYYLNDLEQMMVIRMCCFIQAYRRPLPN
jgi:transcription-repair coupling factor (superfamily II helicase)